MNSLVDSLGDPHACHAMFVHAPITLAVLGVIPLIALARTGFRARPLRVAVVAWYLALSASAGLAAVSGNAAAHRLGVAAVPLSPDERAAVAVHQHRGERAWIWPLIPAALVALTTMRRGRAAAGTGAALAGAGVAIWFGVIAHAGGRLVYARGIGVPERPSLRVGVPVP